jgi:hypothetical protein
MANTTVARVKPVPEDPRSRRAVPDGAADEVCVGLRSLVLMGEKARMHPENWIDTHGEA